MVTTMTVNDNAAAETGANKVITSLTPADLKAIRVALADYEKTQPLNGYEALLLEKNDKNYRVTIWVERQKAYARGGGDELDIYLISRVDSSIQSKEKAFAR